MRCELVTHTHKHSLLNENISLIFLPERLLVVTGTMQPIWPVSISSLWISSIDPLEAMRTRRTEELGTHEKLTVTSVGYDIGQDGLT